MMRNKPTTSIMLSIFVIIFMLMLLELFLNLFPKYTFYYIYPRGLFENAEAPLDFRMVPNFRGKTVGEYNVDIRINSDGLRDYEHDLNSSNFRILALGDSLAFGYGVDINDTFLSVIERQLGVEIIKAGVPAYGQDNQLNYFMAKGKDYNPDIVIIFYYFNDNADNEGITDRKVAFGNLIQKYRYDSFTKWRLYLYTKIYSTESARLFTEGFYNLKSYFVKSKEAESIEYRLFLKNQTQESKEWKKTKALFEEFKKNAGNSKLLIAYVPDKRQIYSDKFYEHFDSNIDIDKPNKVLKSIAASLNITYIDVTQEMRNLNFSNLYFKYDPHFNENGHKLFATLVGSELIKNHPS